MRFTRLAAVGGVVVLGLLCWLAAIGVKAVSEVLVTVVALVVLVGGGNWLSGRGSVRTQGAPPSSSTVREELPSPTAGSAEPAPGVGGGAETPGP